MMCTQMHSRLYVSALPFFFFGPYKRGKTKEQKQRKDFAIFGTNEDGVRVQYVQTLDKQATTKYENESTVEVEHQHRCTVLVR